jgi:hypothetical protein
MASSNGVIFPKSMADILADPIDICFGSMLVESYAPAACLIIEGNTVTSDQQVRTDLLAETHPPTPHDLIAGLDRVEDMLSNMIKVRECAKRPRTTSTPPPLMPHGTPTHCSYDHPGETFEILDREFLMVSVDVPP